MIFDFEQVFSAEVLIRSIGPEVLAHNLMQLLSKGFCKAVSDGLHHDVVIVVPLQVKQHWNHAGSNMSTRSFPTQ